jgi:diguanylate cyclase (GGDEF)-like protein
MLGRIAKISAVVCGLRTGRQASDANPAIDPTGRRRRLASTAVAVLGVLASVALAVIFVDADARVEDARFGEQARDYQQTIGAALGRATDVVKVEQAYFESSEGVTRAEFARFAKTVRETLAFGLRDTTWVPRVTAAERDGFERAVRAEGFPTFEIRERDTANLMVRAADRAEYFPALYVDAGALAPKVLGFDLASEAARLRALTRARETGQPAVTSSVRLALVHPEDIPKGYITFVPVYAGSAAERGPLRGFVIGVLTAGRLIEYVLAGKPAEQDLDVYLFDPKAAPDDRSVYWHSSRARAAPEAAPSEAAMRAGPHAEALVRLADREWGMLLARPAPVHGGGFGGRGFAALLLGLAATLGVVAYLTATLRHALRLEALTARLRHTGADLLSKGEAIAHLARHDTLTGLPNRIAFQEQLESALYRPGQGGGVCVLCLDLDRFKAVNDTFGHPAGDALLVLVAARLRMCLRAEDTAARMGGDEFAILLLSPTPGGAEALARRLGEEIGQPYDIRGQHMTVGLTVGIAFPLAGRTDADLLMRNADFALYRAKQAGRGTWRVFEPEMEAAVQARRAMEASLRQAVAELSFALYFQPVVRLSNRQICGAEALLRWDCPGIGAVSPAEFIPLAEECGLIVPIGNWVLRTACREAARWAAPVRVSVNLSPAQFASPDLLALVVRALDVAGLDPSRLELEITETLMLKDSHKVMATLHALKALGVSIAMDDFGTGYSSLSYLHKFPFDTLKIDESFVRHLPVREDCRAIVHAVTELCRNLGIATTAEGVETEEQLRCVMAEGCDKVQGYLFGRPMSAAQMAELLAGNVQVVVT